MPRRAIQHSTSNIQHSQTTAQALGSLIKSARDIMRKDKGLSGDLDRLPMFTWIMFLKFLDDMEQIEASRAKLRKERFRPSIEPPYRWRDWAAKEDGITGPELLAEESRNGLGARPSDAPPGLPILRISAGTSRADAVVDEQDYKYLAVTDSEEELYRLKAGDLLACRFNGNLHFVGRFSLFTGSSGETRLYPDKLIRFRVDRSRLLPAFVRFAMNSPKRRAIVESFCATTAGNIGISATNLKTIPAPVPPLAEQLHIVAHLDALQAKVDSLKALQARTAAELDALLPSILDRAFKGEL